MCPAWFDLDCLLVCIYVYKYENVFRMFEKYGGVFFFFVVFILWFDVILWSILECVWFFYVIKASS